MESEEREAKKAKDTALPAFDGRRMDQPFLRLSPSPWVAVARSSAKGKRGELLPVRGRSLAQDDDSDVLLSRRIASTVGIVFLFCVFLNGCSHPRDCIDGTETINDLVKDAFIGSPEATTAGGIKASAAVNGLPLSLWVDTIRNNSAAPAPVTGFLIEPPATLDSTNSLTVPADGPIPQAVWGILDMRGFPSGQQVASNGVEYKPLFLLDLDFNIMLWREQGLYLFLDSSFWGQKAAAGITNPSQGSFDFSKREFDLNLGVAWNYTGPLEARLSAYSFNNLNRGNSQLGPSGFNDGVGLENRFYLGEAYANLGTSAFDPARATFLSVGYYPTKTMVDANGNQFKPGPFARAYLTWDLWGEQCYLYGDIQFIAASSFLPTLLNLDAGLAARPFPSVPRLEFRVGTQDMLNLQGRDLETGIYLAIRYLY